MIIPNIWKNKHVPNHQPDMNMYICYVYVMSRDSWNPLILWIVSKTGKQIMSLTDLSAV